MKIVAAKCPSCGANIEVDKNSNKTKCEFCNSSILVDDAIAKYKLEISGEVEVKNIPKLENYLKIAERYYNDGDYEEAYNAYSKAYELDPDNYLVIARTGFCKALCANYINFDTLPILNGIKHIYEILIENNDEEEITNHEEEITKLIIEGIEHVNKLKQFAISFYETHQLNFQETTEYINKLILCLNSLEGLYVVGPDDKDFKKFVIDHIITTIDDILKNKRYYTGYYKNGIALWGIYKINKALVKDLYNKKVKYKNEKEALDPQEQIEKNNQKTNLTIQSKPSKYAWIAWIILSIPVVTIVLVMAFVFLTIIVGLFDQSSQGTWVSESGMRVIIINPEITIVTSDGKTIAGNYTGTSTVTGIFNMEHTYEIKSNDGQEYKFYYNKKRPNGKPLCYAVNDKCVEYFEKED